MLCITRSPRRSPDGLAPELIECPQERCAEPISLSFRSDCALKAQERAPGGRIILVEACWARFRPKRGGRSFPLVHIHQEAVVASIGFQVFAKERHFPLPEVFHRSASEAVALIGVSNKGDFFALSTKAVIHFECPENKALVFVSIGKQHRRVNLCHVIYRRHCNDVVQVFFWSEAETLCRYAAQ